MKRRVIVIAAALGVFLCAVPMASSAPDEHSAARNATNCGTINIRNDPRDAQVLAHNVRCKQARRVARYAVGDGPQPKGWICSASLGRCAKGDFSSKRWVKVKWA